MSLIGVQHMMHACMLACLQACRLAGLQDCSTPQTLSTPHTQVSLIWQVFGHLSYCEQVRLVAQSKLFIGVHGQAQENGIFLRPGNRMMNMVIMQSCDHVINTDGGRHLLEVRLHGDRTLPYQSC